MFGSVKGIVMEDIRTYQIHINGQVIESEIAQFCPSEWTIDSNKNHSSLLTIETDQSGLIGLLRHLHGLGFELLSFNSI